MTFFDLSYTDLSGQPQPCSQYRGGVVLVVNVASQCGFTPQYAELQQLHSELAGRGLTIIGFPCDQFAHQEPGDSEQIAQFCQARFGVTFPLSEKVEVNGPNRHPIFAHLCAELPGVLGSEAVKWNFTKFLVGRDGRGIARFAPRRTPASLGEDLAAALG